MQRKQSKSAENWINTQRVCPSRATIASSRTQTGSEGTREHSRTVPGSENDEFLLSPDAGRAYERSVHFSGSFNLQSVENEGSQDRLIAGTCRIQSFHFAW